jgi:hypothetical protein
LLQATLKQNQFDEIKHLRFCAPSTSSIHPLIMALLAWQDHSVGRPDLAEAKYLRALQGSLETAGLYNNLGYAILAKGSMKANTPLAEDQHPGSAADRNSERRANELLSALQLFRSAIVINPSLIPARRNYIAAELELHDLRPSTNLDMSTEYMAWIVENYPNEDFSSIVDLTNYDMLSPHSTVYDLHQSGTSSTPDKSQNWHWRTRGVYDPLRAIDPRSDSRLSFIADNFFDTTDLDARPDNL